MRREGRRKEGRKEGRKEENMTGINAFKYLHERAEIHKRRRRRRRRSRINDYYEYKLMFQHTAYVFGMHLKHL